MIGVAREVAVARAVARAVATVVMLAVAVTVARAVVRAVAVARAVVVAAWSCCDRGGVRQNKICHDKPMMDKHVGRTKCPRRG